MKNHVFVQEMILRLCRAKTVKLMRTTSIFNPNVSRHKEEARSNSSAPRSLRTPFNPSHDFDYEPFDQPSDDDYSKHFCEKNWHTLETCIERFVQSRVSLVLALLIFRLIFRFPFCSILLRSRSLQCIVLGPQSVIAHAQLRAVKPVSLPCFENPRIYPDTHKSEHR
jgi:hypothetical protein